MNLSTHGPFHYVLPVYRELFSEGLYLTHVGWEKVVVGESYPKQTRHPEFYHFSWDEGRVLPEFCLAFVMAGGGEFETRAGRRELAAGEAFLVGAGEWHRHRPSPDSGWSLCWIHFNGELPLRWLAEGWLGSAPRLVRPAHPELFTGQFERLLRSVAADPGRNAPDLSWQAIGLLSHLAPGEKAGAVSGHDPTGDELVDRAVEHIWNFSHGLLSVPAVVAACGGTRRTLERRFRAAKGHGLLDEIQHCRFTRAAWLLLETDLPVKAVVGRAGFSSHEQMRLVFKKAAGMSPEAYRRSGGSSGATSEAG